MRQHGLHHNNVIICPCIICASFASSWQLTAVSSSSCQRLENWRTETRTSLTFCRLLPPPQTSSWTIPPTLPPYHTITTTDWRSQPQTHYYVSKWTVQGNVRSASRLFSGLSVRTRSLAIANRSHWASCKSPCSGIWQ